MQPMKPGSSSPQDEASAINPWVSDYSTQTMHMQLAASFVSPYRLWSTEVNLRTESWETCRVIKKRIDCEYIYTYTTACKPLYIRCSCTSFHYWLSFIILCVYAKTLHHWLHKTETDILWCMHTFLGPAAMVRPVWSRPYRFFGGKNGLAWIQT